MTALRALDITALFTLRTAVLMAFLFCQFAGIAHGAAACLDVDDRISDEIERVG